MDVTRRFWGALGCAGILAVGAIAFDSTTLLVAAGFPLAWLIGAQILVLRTALDLEQSADVTVVSDDQFPVVDEPTTVTLQAAIQSVPDGDVTVGVSFPPAANGSQLSARFTEPTASATSTVEWSTGGTFSIGPAVLTVVGPFGLFVETVTVGDPIDVHPTPRQPDTVHVGRGGDRVAAAFGAHTTDGTGPGIEPAELREYHPGDDVRQIDWKATARLGDPHVMESTAETDRRTVLLVDQRSTMAVGPDGATVFDYARASALAVAGNANTLGDPLGLYLVGDEGLTVTQRPGSSPAVYDSIERALREATPTRGGREQFVEPERGTTDAHRMATRLEASDGAFADALAPLLDSATPYVQRIEARPLFRAAKTYVGALQGTTWSILITDDRNRGELRETVDLLRRGNGHVLVILAPSALFAPDGLADVDAAARSYGDFETFRREIAAMDRVDAFELAPGDRLATVLSAAEGVV